MLGDQNHMPQQHANQQHLQRNVGQKPIWVFYSFLTAITAEEESLPMAVIGFPLPKTNFFFAEAGVRFKGASPSAIALPGSTIQ
jgi:hypothetical protein